LERLAQFGPSRLLARAATAGDAATFA